jgi:hypothetical protein
MQRFRTEWMALGLVTIIGVVLVVWMAHRPAGDSSLSPAERGPANAGSGAIKPAEREWLPQPAPAVAAAPQDNLSKEALTALVLARLREWEDQDDSELRPQRMQELDALLDGTNMLEIVQELPPTLMDYAFALPSLHQRLMSDPKAAADWMSSHTNISEAHVFTLVHDWEQKDPEEMQQYLAGLPEGEWKQTVMAAASNEALSSDPVEAIVWAEQMSPGERQTGFLEMAATDWVKRDPDAAAQWVGRVNDPALREQLVGALAIGYADIDPVQAAECAIQSVQPGAVRDRSVAEIAWVWAMREPVAAMAWVAQFPEGPARQMALGNVMNIWGNRDRAAALTWLEGLPAGSLQTEAATDLQTAVPAAESSDF